MKPHVRKYIEFARREHGIEPHELFCEITGRVGGTDINHINARGMGGNPSGDKDHITNLMCMTRELHMVAGDITMLKPLLHRIHAHWMSTGRPYLADHGDDPEIISLMKRTP